MLSFAATQPNYVVASNETTLQLFAASPSEWAAASLSLDLALGNVELPVALIPHPRWSELLQPTVRELPQQLLAAIVSHLLSPVIAAIAEWTSTSPQIVRWPSQYTQGTRSCFGLMVQTPSSNEIYKIVIAVLNPAVVDLFTARAGTTKQQKRCDTAHLHAAGLIEFSNFELPLGELRELDVGDVVLADCASPTAFPHSIAGKLLAGNTPVAAGYVRANTFLIDSVEWRAMDLSTPPHSLTTDQAPDTLETLTLNCRIVIPAGEVRVNDVAQWVGGASIPLPVPVDSDQILLQAGQQTVARGRLIAIGEQLGLEIVETFVR